MENMEIIKLILDVITVPVLLFAYKINRDVEDIKKSLSSISGKVEAYEKDNREEHRHVLEHLHDLDKRNSIEHAQLGLKAQA